MRSLTLLLAAAAAYAFLRGWPGELHPLLRACFAVLVLVLGFGLWNRRGRTSRPKARAVRSPAAADYLAMGLGVLGVECFFLFFLTAAPPKAESLAIALEARLRPRMAAARKAEAEALQNAGGPQAGNWLWDSHGRRPLPNEFSAQPSNKPEVFLEPGNEAVAMELLTTRPYVRAFALDEYSSATWSAHSMPAEIFPAGLDGRIPFPQPASRTGPELAYRLFHAADPGGQDVLTALQGLRSVELPRVRHVAPGIQRLDPLDNPGAGYEYLCVSQPLTFDTFAARGSLASLAPSVTAPEHLLALPRDPGLRDGLLEIAVRTQGPLEQRLAALRLFLRKNCTYSLTIANEDGLDPLENFLFHERRGHCEFFATAGALLARALGIPSRVAYGWSGGRWFEAQNLFVFRAREAHAWTELYFDDVGWVIFDTTPPGALDAANSSTAAPGERAPLGKDAFLEYVNGAYPSLGPWPWVALAAGAVCLPLALLTLRLRRRPPRTADPDAVRFLPEAPRYMTRFKRATARLGHPMPPARTLRQHLDHLGRHDLVPGFGHELLKYHYAVTYAQAPPDKSRERHLTHAIASWRPA